MPNTTRAGGRPPKPTALKILEGNPGQRRLNEREPVYEARLADPPVHLDGDAKRLWRSEGKKLLASGVLTVADAGMFGVYVQTMAHWRQINKLLNRDGPCRTTDDGKQETNPLWKQFREATQDYQRIAVEFGLTPSSRTRVQAVKINIDKVNDEWWLEQPRHQGVN